MEAQFWIAFALVIFYPLVIVSADLVNNDATSTPWLNPTVSSEYTRTPLADIPPSGNSISDDFTSMRALLYNTELTSEPVLQGENIRRPFRPASPNTPVVPSRNGRLLKKNLQGEALLQQKTTDRLADFGETSTANRSSSRRTSDFSAADPASRSASLRKTGPVQIQKRSPPKFRALCNYEKVIKNDPAKNTRCSRECVKLSIAIEDMYEKNSYNDGIDELFDDCAGFTKGSCSKTTRTGGKKYAICNCIGWTDADDFKTEYAYTCRTRFMKIKTGNGMDVPEKSRVTNSGRNQWEHKQKRSYGTEAEPQK